MPVSTHFAHLMRQIPLPIGIRLPPNFESFLPGHNAAALAQLIELLQQYSEGGAVPPIYLWGPAGSGKSHLLRSLAGHFRSEGSEVACFDAAAALPWPLDDAVALTVLDDCEAYDNARQQAAFALFADASARGGLVAAAGRLPPVDLPLREDLRSRLGWGHVIALLPLADDEVAMMLTEEAARRGLKLPKDMTTYLLTHRARDPKSMMQLLDRIDEFALQHKRAPTVPMLRQMLADETPPGEFAE